MKSRSQFSGVLKNPLGLIISVSLLLPSIIDVKQLISYEGRKTYTSSESNLITANEQKIPYSNLLPSSIIIVILATIAWQNFRQRQKLAIALQESEAKFSNLFTTIPDPLWVATLAEGKLLKVNKAMVDFLGYSQSEILNKTCLELTLWNNPEDLTEFRQKLRHDGVTQDFEVIFRLASGKLRTVLLSGSVTSFQQQDCAIVVLKDISQRKEFEAQLKEQEIFLRSIYEGVEHAIFVVDVTKDGQFRFVSINRAHQKLTGLTLESLKGKTPAEARLPTWEVITQHYQDCLDAGETISYEEEIMLQGKQTYWYTTLTPLYDLDGCIYRLIGTGININQLKEIQGQLLTKEAQLQHILAISPVVIYSIVEKPGKTIRFEQLSKAFEEIHEISLAVVAENPEVAFQQIHPEDRDKYIEAIANALAKMQVFNHQWRIITPSGKTKWLEASSRPELRDNGEIVWHGIVQDISDRRQIELELQAKTEELDRFFSLALDLLCIADADGYFRRLNCQWEKTLGYPMEQLEGSNFFDYIHLEDQESTLEIISILEQQQQIVGFINRYRCHDGSYRWLEWHSFFVEGIIYAAARDITERKDWELALTRSEEKYRQIIDTTLEGVCLVDVDGKTSFVNQRLLEMLGYPQSAIVGKSLSDFIIADGNLNLPEYDDQHRPWQFRCQDGSKIWTIVSTTNIHDEYGNYSGCIHLFTNITQLAEIQEALNSSKNQLSSILNSSLDGIMAFEAVRDEQGKIIDFDWLLTNPTACILVGKSESELIGHRLLEAFPSTTANGLFAKYVEVVESGKPLQTEIYYQHDGIDAWFKIMAVKLNNGFAVTFSNVTQIKESEKALQQANQQLEKQINTLKQRNQEMLLLSEMSDFLQTCLTVEEACLAIADLIQPLFPGCGGSIFLRNSASNQIEKIVIWGKDFNQQDSFAVEDCWGLRRGRSHWVDQKRLKLCCHHLGSLDSCGGSLCLPLLALGKTLGLLYLSTEQEEFLSPNKQQLARMVSEQIASIIANLKLRATLEHQSIRDPLTELYNRRYLDISLPKAIQLAQQQQQSVGIIMLDIDYFRSINNNYGHEGGDYVLQLVGKLLQDIGANSKILVCRYGGEEITLILSGFNLEQTSHLAQIIRQSIANLRVDYKGRQITFTASLGVACFPDHGYSGTDVLREADKALLCAKENGRNQVVIALQDNCPLS